MDAQMTPVVDERGVIIGLAMFATDITVMRKSQDSLRRSQKSLAEAQRVTHLGSWEWYTQNDATLVSDEYYRIFGITEGSEITSESYLNCVHPEDRGFVKTAVDKFLSRGTPYRIDYRIILPSGEVRFVQEEAQAFLDEAEKPIRRIGTVRDITLQRQTEVEIQRNQTQLVALSRHLIKVQENERRHIALELHDQLSQDLALMSIEIEHLIQDVPELGNQLTERLQKLATYTQKVSSQVQTLFHQLHPAKLIHLGLVTASQSLCDEVSASSGIQIDFSHLHVPEDIEEDVSICLYRVLQDSLSNLAKHSGTNSAQVELNGSDGKIRLRVGDTGVGFDSDNHEHFGLGLISMRERLSLLGGEFLIESQPSGGTRITACVPVIPAVSPD